MLIFRVLPRLIAEMLKIRAMNCGNDAGWRHQRTRSPRPHNQRNHRQSEHQNEIRHDPGHTVKSALGRRRHHGCAVYDSGIQKLFSCPPEKHFCGHED
jgi:hypothetical protein